MNLDIGEWKEFQLGRIFTIKYGVNLELNACEEYPDENIPSVNFVSRTSENNGVSSRVALIENILPQKAGLISIAGGGSVLSTFLQKEPFYSGRDLYTLEAKEDITDETKLFIITLIEKNKYKYSYGRQANKTMKNLIIKLPIRKNLDGTPFYDDKKVYSEEGYIPDWTFMDSYIKSLNYRPISTKNGTSSDKNTLSWDNWVEFDFSDIFFILNGKGITKEEIEDNPGDFNAVQSGEENNGVIGKIDKQYCINMKYTLTDEPCLTVARSGSAGFVSFQRYGCVVGDSAKILLLKNEEKRNAHIYLFLKTILMANKYKYTYGRKVTEENYSREKLLLPAKTLNEKRIPDWGFMENYIKSMPYGDRI